MDLVGGDKRYRVKAISVSKVLSMHNIDIAKFYCEGCEYSLLKVPCKIIRKVPQYVIEYHNGLDSLKDKFEKCGFKVEKLWKLGERTGGLKAAKINVF